MRLKQNLYGANHAENSATFEDLIAQNEAKIVNLIYGMVGNLHTAQDLAQEAFLKAFKAYDTFEGKAKFSTWLYRIAVNITLDYQRKESHKKEALCTEGDPGDQQAPTTTSDPDHKCQKNAVKEILFQQIAQLPEQQREVFVLREINGCSTKEVAEILSCSVELVKWRLHKARSELRKKLQGEVRYRDTGHYSLTPHGLE
ncbi:MAG: RNA polymerase sigma factor [Clostridia bacterium]|nr:RNA polymerase sigma factor [Clostridia bacterium]